MSLAAREVHVVTCTLGEEGEVIGERYSQLAVDEADQLGGYRIAELTAALRALGLGFDPTTSAGPDTGGTPAWRARRRVGTDASSTPIPPRPSAHWSRSSTTFARTSSSPTTRTAATATPTTSRPTGSPPRAVEAAAWRGAQVLLDGHRRSAAEQALARWATCRRNGSASTRCRSATPTTGSTPSSTPPTYCPAKIAALRAHATQVTVAPNGQSFALSNNSPCRSSRIEHYVLVSGEPGDRDARGWETDLLAGLTLA